MSERKRGLPLEVEKVRVQVESWRQNRVKRGAMPADLWRAAAQLAKVHGINPISCALRLSYESLKTWVVGMEGKAPAVATKKAEVSGFVEVPGLNVVRSAQISALEIEFIGVSGERMVIRPGGCTGVDVTSIIADFWQRQQ
ncbi:MAG: hypothetical protein QNJ97_16035 [Myxococcota bacterium]|nr:hypothetical protein [Myxococcota bacterium]